MWLLIVDYFIIQKRNAITIHHSIATARQKESRSGINVNHDYGNEFLDYDSITNVYFIGDVDGRHMSVGRSLGGPQQQMLPSHFTSFFFSSNSDVTHRDTHAQLHYSTRIPA